MTDRNLRAPLGRVVATVALVLLMGGCAEQEARPDYVARLGDRYLLEDDLAGMLSDFPAQQDSTEARRQLIEQWVTSEVLYQEALRRGLQEVPEVERRLRESARSVLVNSLITQLYEENEVVPSTSEMQAYFERHRDQLRLRESFVRVRYVVAESRSEAEEARRAMQQAALADRDSIWSETVDRHGVEADWARQLSMGYHPESRLFAGKPSLQQALVALSEGQTAPIVEADSAFHVIQLAQRVAPGTIPEPAWIEDELARRLIIQGRKQLYARQVQRLRNEAVAREELEIK